MTKQRFEQFKELYREFSESCDKLALKVSDFRGNNYCYDLTHSDYWMLDSEGDPKCVGYDRDAGWLEAGLKAEWLWESDEQIKADIEELKDK